MALLTSLSPISISPALLPSLLRFRNQASSRLMPIASSLSSSSSAASDSPPSSSSSTQSIPSSNQTPNHFADAPASVPSSDATFNYALASPSSNAILQIARSSESTIERVIFDFRFLALLAVGGSLAGSLLCFLNVRNNFYMIWDIAIYHVGCVYIFDAYKVYWTCCLKGVHTGQMVLRLVEAIDVYLAGTVMLIFGMGLYGLFISNAPPGMPPDKDRALKGSSLFGMFALKERPKWMKITSLDELKTKVGHVIVMILLVKMFERSKMVTIATGLDLLSYSVCVFLSSASLYILHNLHK